MPSQCKYTFLRIFPRGSATNKIIWIKKLFECYMGVGGCVRGINILQSCLKIKNLYINKYGGKGRLSLIGYFPQILVFLFVTPLLSKLRQMSCKHRESNYDCSYFRSSSNMLASQFEACILIVLVIVSTVMDSWIYLFW